MASPTLGQARVTGSAGIGGDLSRSAGLSAAEAAERLRQDGPNVIGGSGRRTWFAILLAQVSSPLVLILVVASLVSLLVGDDVTAGIIAAIVMMSGTLGFVQEARSESAVAALQARLTLRATVLRDGERREVPIHEVVRGDLVTLSAGDIVPADVVIVAADHLYIDEASLTGESAPSLKVPRSAASGPSAPDDHDDHDGLGFFGTSVVSGTGSAVVTATGARTSYGEIARHLAERAPENDFQRGVRAFGGLVFRVTTILVIAVLVINLALHRPLLDSLLFAIALAVGLTPELLPAIVTLNLTHGAQALSRQGVLVKRLPAIQNLGSVTVLCTDKTGTLTTGTLGVVRSVGIDRDDAAEAARALEFAYLNSHFQTGFTNPLDAAILAGTPAPPDLADYRKLAELPYDFARRLLSVVVHGTGDEPVLVTKGAPEAVLARSNQVREEQGPRPIGPGEHDRLARLVDSASADGFRLVAVGSRLLAPDELGPPDSTGTVRLVEPDAAERDLVFEGLILFSDPPKDGVSDTIAQLARDGVALKVVTGDNDLVARHVAQQVGLAVDGVLTGDEIRQLTHPALVARAKRTTLFARVDPDQKLQVIRALHDGGAVVGYLGDGINDAPALHAADVGISVDNATDVARSAADIILLEPSLAAIHQGVIEGRRTFANTLKYIRMGTSSNFGNMLSMTGAALLLPFLPMTPGQILLNNLIYDASQTAIPSDTVDAAVADVPAHWDVRAIQRFMLIFGPISSLFDFLTFGVLLLAMGANAQQFQTGWFIESLCTQVLVILAIRTRLSPFWRSRPSRPLIAAIVAALAAAVLIPLSPVGPLLGFAPMPPIFWLLLIALVIAYLALVELVKRRFEPNTQPRPVSISTLTG